MSPRVGRSGAGDAELPSSISESAVRYLRSVGIEQPAAHGLLLDLLRRRLAGRKYRDDVASGRDEDVILQIVEEVCAAGWVTSGIEGDRAASGDRIDLAPELAAWCRRWPKPTPPEKRGRMVVQSFQYYRPRQGVIRMLGRLSPLRAARATR